MFNVKGTAKLVSVKGTDKGINMTVEYTAKNNKTNETYTIKEYIVVFEPSLIKYVTTNCKGGELLEIAGYLKNNKIVSKSAIDTTTNEFCQYYTKNIIATQIKIIENNYLDELEKLCKEDLAQHKEIKKYSIG